MEIEFGSRFRPVEDSIWVAAARGRGRYFGYDRLEDIYWDGLDVLNARQLLDYDIDRIQTWTDVVAYSLLFLKGGIPRTVFHDGGYASETKYILPLLQQIHHHNFITLDSQPGCVIEHTPGCHLLQLPYLRLAGLMTDLNQLLLHLDPSIIIYQITPEPTPIVPINTHLLTKLPHLHLNTAYGSICLSVNTPNINDSLRSNPLNPNEIDFNTYDHILTNWLFEHILATLRNLDPVNLGSKC